MVIFLQVKSLTRTMDFEDEGPDKKQPRLDNDLCVGTYL